jgi:hypothetical protein
VRFSVVRQDENPQPEAAAEKVVYFVIPFTVNVHGEPSEARDLLFCTASKKQQIPRANPALRNDTASFSAACEARRHPTRAPLVKVPGDGVYSAGALFGRSADRIRFQMGEENKL